MRVRDRHFGDARLEHRPEEADAGQVREAGEVLPERIRRAEGSPIPEAHDPQSEYALADRLTGLTRFLDGM